MMLCSTCGFANTRMNDITNLLLRCLLLPGLFWSTGPVHAHHSFAVHFLPDKTITISGTVTEFRFTNPHGLVFLTVQTANGEEQHWRAESNSPNVLRRRGWSSTVIKAGDSITIEGYPTRDGSFGMRIQRVIFADGRELLGQGRVMVGPPGSD